MRLRVARKMDPGAYHHKRQGRDKRTWWKVYSVDQLQRAESRLRRSWGTHKVTTVDDEGRKWLSVTHDYFAMNRVQSRRVRQGALNRIERDKKK